MTQKFSNNFDGALSATLAIAGTTATVIDGSGLSSPTGGAFELLTLTDDSAFEIVRMTARSGNTLTITRAQEGTTAQEWAAATRIFAGVTAGTLLRFQEPDPMRFGSGTVASGTDSIALGIDSEATATQALSVGHDSSATGPRSITLGAECMATGEWSIAVGYDARAQDEGAIALGYAWAQSEGGIAIGNGAWTDGDFSVAIGLGAQARTDTGSVAIGQYAWAEGEESVQVGANGNIFGDYCIGIGGVNIDSGEEHIFQVGALPAVGRAHFWKDATNAHWSMVACQSVIMSEKINLRATTTHTITIPTAARFFVDEVGLVITDASGVTTQPTVRWGITGETEKFVAATLLTGLDAAHKRQRFTSLSSDDGVGTLRVEITEAGAGTDLRGRFYWKGFAVVNTV